jgi:hypothetical protein
MNISNSTGVGSSTTGIIFAHIPIDMLLVWGEQVPDANPLLEPKCDKPWGRRYMYDNNMYCKV